MPRDDTPPRERSSPGIQEEVEKFLARNAVDERAAAALRSESAVAQRAVLDRGDLFDCLNPSAALMGRINVAKENAAAQHRSLLAPSGGSSSGSGGDKASEPLGPAPTSQELQDFVRENRIDDVAARALLEASPGTQRSVLSRGTLTDCRNPSAVCLARLRESRSLPGPVAGPQPQESAAVAEEVERFINKNDVDFRAAAALRAEAPATQRAVLDRGDLHDCQNPSAALMGRINVAREGAAFEARRSLSGGLLGGGNSKFAEEVEEFIRENRIDGVAAGSLREADPAIQKDVMDRGSLTDCRNPSAVCLSRIRDAKTLGVVGSSANNMSTSAALYQQYILQQQVQQQMLLAGAASNPASMMYLTQVYAAYGYPPAAIQQILLQYQQAHVQQVQAAQGGGSGSASGDEAAPGAAADGASAASTGAAGASAGSEVSTGSGTGPAGTGLPDASSTGPYAGLPPEYLSAMASMYGSSMPGAVGGTMPGALSGMPPPPLGGMPPPPLGGMPPLPMGGSMPGPMGGMPPPPMGMPPLPGSMPPPPGGMPPMPGGMPPPTGVPPPPAGMPPLFNGMPPLPMGGLGSMCSTPGSMSSHGPMDGTQGPPGATGGPMDGLPGPMDGPRPMPFGPMDGLGPPGGPRPMGGGPMGGDAMSGPPAGHLSNGPMGGAGPSPGPCSAADGGSKAAAASSFWQSGWRPATAAATGGSWGGPGDASGEGGGGDRSSGGSCGSGGCGGRMWGSTGGGCPGDADSSGFNFQPWDSVGGANGLDDGGLDSAFEGFLAAAGAGTSVSSSYEDTKEGSGSWGGSGGVSKGNPLDGAFRLPPKASSFRASPY